MFPIGIQRAEFMVKFLEDLLQPLTILQSIEEVKDFVTQHDVSFKLTLVLQLKVFFLINL